MLMCVEVETVLFFASTSLTLFFIFVFSLVLCLSVIKYFVSVWLYCFFDVLMKFFGYVFFMFFLSEKITRVGGRVSS